MDKQRESSRARRICRTKVDWFGIIMMFVLLVCSLAIFARLMATKMLTTTNMVLIMVVRGNDLRHRGRRGGAVRPE